MPQGGVSKRSRIYVTARRTDPIKGSRRIAITRRIITGHNAQGKAIILFDGICPHRKVRPVTDIVATLMWVTDETPADIGGTEDRAARDIGVAPPISGSIFRVVEFPPEKSQTGVSNAEMLRQMGLNPSVADARHPGMHRTRSVDYAIILEGEIDMLLDDSEVHLKSGDFLIQQGTNHAWVNRNDRPCKIAFILIDAAAPAAWQR